MKKSSSVELQSVFRIESGNKFDLNKMKKCPPSKDAIAFIGRSGKENGIMAFVQEKRDVHPYEASLITVALGGVTLASFVQPRGFYTAQNIAVLTPRTKMSLSVKLYYCLCIEANRFRYTTYGREANRTLKMLLVPSRKSVPKWVSGVIKDAKTELWNDLDAIKL